MIKILTLVLILLLDVNTYAQQTAAAKLADMTSGYDIQDSVLITTRDGAIISAMVARKKGDVTPKPVILQYTIYVRDNGRDLRTIKESVDNGYVGVIAYSRGKRFSPDEIFPYENEANDTYDVIDWISRQEWCNGSVGMYGGSYNGFTQWAACKTLHPALKTIVPYVAARPGNGLPMENNIFINPNYEWSFYVGNNKYLDTAAGNDRQRFRRMQFKWWDSGAAYNKMDSIDGTPNKLFQRWISHPAFDSYWQSMTPYQKDFAQIKIPVLAFDGYYNDGQSSGLYYLRELQKYSPETPAYLIIGPYGHFGTQRGGESVLYDYSVDSVALFNISAITYQWFDHILKDGPKPSMLKDKINYEVMGANEWRSAPSIDKMSNGSMTLYLTATKAGRFYAADSHMPDRTGFLTQDVDFADRENSNNNYYPDPIIRKDIDTSNGFYFISDPLEETILINGSFAGEISASINKKDIDIGVTLYEVMPDGEYFHLSYFIGRASYARDITHRQLLTPNTKVTIPFSNTHLISKQLSKGSRILIHLNVNKNPFSELNYGTGKTVTEETINDAKEPLRIKWYNDSFVKIPVTTHLN
ncbi:MAG TPA: peptidase S15 [Bacteroidales bacterium]|nr:MAG: peptidase S15 [Bacteroidetes bacterium GWE2_42_24]OFY27942.1 MAG: peptidase S15 [Bacteroidetes bacterium GWF2_43_11]PKP27484.1 MAG: peptidase S15 [Bacteroidetes bacterium HGW-Bacteroidetes-22]HAQ64661.1 peptidase S15 [Bacteroidales bacterium]HBZ66558.1 peptidase S15 [Bacteroidales bacterium]